MIQNLIFTVNTVLPVFILVIIGFILKRLNVLNDNFSDVASKLVFKVALPANLFLNVSSCNIKEEFDLKLYCFTAISTLLSFALIWIISTLFIKNKPTLGAFVQGAYRSNYALIGIPLTISILGQEAVSKSSILLAFIIPLLNVLAVILLTFTSKDAKNGIGNTILNIIKNPLIIACLLGAVFSILNINLSALISNTIGLLSDLSTPLALITIGSSLTILSLKRTFVLSVVSSFIKTALLPALFIPIAILLGFKGADVGILFIYFAAPTAVSSYIMSRAMKSDADLSGNIVLISTFMSLITCFIGVFLLKNIGII